jgi:hypothetical protein
LVAISYWRRQTGGTRPNKLWVHSDDAQPHTAKISRDYIGLNRMKQAPHPPIRQIWHPRTFSFWLHQRKADRISRWNSIWTFCSHSGYSGGNPAGDLECSFANGWSDCKSVCRSIVNMSDELKERNILKLILIVRFACATRDVGHPIHYR